ncbi:hypothetical protein [Paenibacillus bovis]|uniref:Uncharacterized protein n=1 Tax=Paenibacillus bovis TaxID=1616788 RepID=A0A172ZEI7_9BACL|nr:hypothetical protein [Paenibacillus bovis]ANF95687.1 hypothetical protein AR543_06530 [Paenibacillus bovis]
MVYRIQLYRTLYKYKGPLVTSDLIDIDQFESLLQPIVQCHIFFLKNGTVIERFPIILGLQKLAYLKDDTLTLEDQQLTHIAMESLPFLIAIDYEDLRSYAYSIFNFMDHQEYIEKFNQHLNQIRHVEEREGYLTYDRFKQIAYSQNSIFNKKTF